MNTSAVPRFLSQSECSDWLTCHLRAWTRWVLGYRAPDDDGPAQRVGSIGHVLLREMVSDAWHGRAQRLHSLPMTAAVQAEAAKRRWSESIDLAAEHAQAIPGARAIWDALDLDHAQVMPDLYSADPATRGGALSEKRIAVPWKALRDGHDRGDDDVMAGINMCSCPAVHSHFAGIEGTPDLVMMPHGAGGPVVVVDYKFRQKPDLGGALVDPLETVPNRQAAWYLILLRAAGLQSAGGFEFWQANAYAGRRLVADDFVRIAQGGGTSQAEDALILQSGLPTRDAGRIGECGMTSADEWAEAHRILTNLRHDRAMADWRAAPPPPVGSRAKPRPPPERLTAAEQEGATRFISDLRARPDVVIRKVPADPEVCRELVRDMIVAVDGPLGQALRGLTPARNLQDHARSNCVRPYGCPIQSPCRASIGTWNVRRTLQDLAEQGALARDLERGAAPLGSMPALATSGCAS